ncbi:MAG: acyl-CoA dehydrogenase family protein [Acidobacteriota bacterium]|jgi:alkylation response protein AidB-like acyl-CoA dehydrogenase|nr:acyl-CoA dehydrogenase family protein [Acidobacteriota bacterium]
MDLRPTDEQRLLRQTVREFAEAEMAPHTMEWDEAQRFPDVKLTTIGEGTSEIQRLVIARLLQQRVS